MLKDNQKQIFCILPKGVALDVAKRLKEVHGIMSSNTSNARGAGKITPLAYRGIAGQSEKEVLSVVVSTETADEIFEFIYHEADINRPHGGIMYMHALQRTTEYSLPEMEDEK
jgi:nitrogen regulatory protein PII